MTVSGQRTTLPAGPVEEPACAQDVLRMHTTTVAIITAGTTTPVGFCATSLATVAFDPALVSFSIRVRSASWATFRTAKHLVAHLLGDDQEDLARRFGRPGPAKFAPPTRWHRGTVGLPVLDGVFAWLVLTPVTRLRVEHQELVVSRVTAAHRGSAVRPLIHHAGRYLSLPTTSPPPSRCSSPAPVRRPDP